MFGFHVPVPWDGGQLLNIPAAKHFLGNRKQWTRGRRNGNKLPNHIILVKYLYMPQTFLLYISNLISGILIWCNSFQTTYLNHFWGSSHSSFQCPLVKFNRNKTASNGNWLEANIASLVQRMWTGPHQPWRKFSKAWLVLIDLGWSVMDTNWAWLGLIAYESMWTGPDLNWIGFFSLYLYWIWVKI